MDGALTRLEGCKELHATHANAHEQGPGKHTASVAAATAAATVAAATTAVVTPTTAAAALSPPRKCMYRISGAVDL